MKIELYEYGYDDSFDVLSKILREALEKKTSKRDKDVRIAQAIGIIETIRNLTITSTDTGDE